MVKRQTSNMNFEKKTDKKFEKGEKQTSRWKEQTEPVAVGRGVLFRKNKVAFKFPSGGRHRLAN